MYPTSDLSSRSAKRRKCKGIFFSHKKINLKLYLVRLMCIDLTGDMEKMDEETLPKKYEYKYLILKKKKFHNELFKIR